MFRSAFFVASVLCIGTAFQSSLAQHDMHAMHSDAGHGSSEMSSMSMTDISDVSFDFELFSGESQVHTREDFSGENLLVAFGFTQCVHVCPLIAANMANTLKIAPANTRGIFISVDTERDTPEITQNYATSFHSNMVGLTGSYDKVSEAAQNFNTTFVVTKSQDNYTVQHSPNIFLISPEGELIDVFAINTPPEQIVASIR